VWLGQVRPHYVRIVLVLGYISLGQVKSGEYRLGHFSSGYVILFQVKSC
jgi:hypothetical protein